jgi:hypothetical protein
MMCPTEVGHIVAILRGRLARNALKQRDPRDSVAAPDGELSPAYDSTPPEINDGHVVH